MQVINESLDDLKKLETAIEDATKGELDYSDKLFLLASSAQSKAIAGLALAIKESGRQDTFRLTTDAPELGAIELLRQIQDDLQYDGHRISESLREKISTILKSPQVR